MKSEQMEVLRGSGNVFRDFGHEQAESNSSRLFWRPRLSRCWIGKDLGEGHPLLGRRMPDLDLITADGPLRAFALLHKARAVLLNLGKPSRLDITPWANRVQLVDAEYRGPWELPVISAVAAPTSILVRPDGYVAWVGDGTGRGLANALTTWFKAPVAA